MKLKPQKQAPFSLIHIELAKYAIEIRKELLAYLNTVVKAPITKKPLTLEPSLIYRLDYGVEPDEVVVSFFQENKKKIEPYDLSPEQKSHMGLLSPETRMLLPHCFGIKSSQLLEALIQTGKAFFKPRLPLTWSEPRSILFKWKFKSNGAQLLTYEEEDIRFFSMERPIFFNQTTGECGLMHTNVSQSFLMHYASIQSYYPSMLEELTDICRQHHLPIPQKMKAQQVTSLEPIPCLSLYGASHSKLSQKKIVARIEDLLPAAELSFDYQVGVVNLFYPEPYLYYQQEGQWYYFERNQTLEEHYMQQLDELPVHFYHPWVAHRLDLQAKTFPKSLSLWESSLQSLLQSGWRIEIEADFPVPVKNRKPFIQSEI